MAVPNMTQAPSKEVNEQLSKLNRSRRYELTKYQKRQIEEADPIYIYNVSPIHDWPRFQGQLGTITIHKREWDKKVSEPTIIPGAVARWFDKGLGRKEVFIEDGMEIAEDICQCSAEYPPPNINNNLTTYGVFITKKPLEEFSEKEQNRLIGEATEKFLKRAKMLILEADGFVSAGNEKWVAKIHLEALEAFNRLTGAKEKRPWAPIDSGMGVASLECPYCGTSHKPNIALCPNCHKVVNQELYDSLEKKAKK